MYLNTNYMPRHETKDAKTFTLTKFHNIAVSLFTIVGIERTI